MLFIEITKKYIYMKNSSLQVVDSIASYLNISTDPATFIQVNDDIYVLKDALSMMA